MIANCITISRILFSILLLGLFPNTFTFAAFYLLCGVTDVLDGFVARKLHTDSEKGAILDSVADLFFAFAYAIKVLPFLSIPLWLWIWASIIAVTKIIGILIASKKAHELSIEHSFENKLTGLFLFFMPLSVCVVDIKFGATFVCIVATITAIKEIVNRKEALASIIKKSSRYV